MKSITAVLGPTNTGKTHLAVERMLGHATGMIGLPLRLLAREVYDKVARKVGPEAVALVTGEEKIVPVSPRFWVCTVEAMPPELEVDFLAIDEVQLAADLDRGHIFTDRILHRRGTQETMLLGSATMRPMIERLLPGTNFITRPRFSKLTFSGSKKLTRLQPRTAVVAFSAETVYGIAELIRRQRGGAAVVLGALSPRTRNAQVALYESGDVDFLVATDAIGMGLNMDVDHIAFAQARKFDGFNFRDLTPAELAQIAGRAGRHMNDGTFGVTGEVEPFSREVVDRIENHNFEPVRTLQWRNKELDFTSIDALLRSLAESPAVAGLMRAQSGADQMALEYLSRDPDIMDRGRGREAVAKLWEVCQIPDYRNTMGSDHANLVARVYGFLSSPEERIPSDWFAQQLRSADSIEGDIDTLATRIAHVRTWTFIANRNDWLADAEEWREKTRAIEDRLSDALHERLSQRFIDRRTSVLMKRMREKERLASSVETGGEIMVEGVFVGHIKGFHFVPDTSGDTSEGRTLRAASMKAVAAEISDRAKQLVDDRVELFGLTRTGAVTWRAAKVAQLVAGSHILKPRVELIADNQLSGPDREAVQKRLEQFVEHRIGEVLKPLVQLEAAQDLQGLARGFAFRLVEQLGNLKRDEIREEVKLLDQEARAGLRRYGVRFGAFHVFLPLLLKPVAAELKVLLWGLQEQQAGRLEIAALPELPPQGLTSVVVDPTAPRGFYHAAGFRICGTRAVRIDMLERLADIIRPRVFWKPQAEGDVRPAGSVEGGGFTVVPDMMSLVGCSGEEFAGILRALGFRSERRKPTPQPVNAAEEPKPTAVAPTAATPADAPSSEEAETDLAPGEAAPAASEAGKTPGLPDGQQAAIEQDVTAASAEVPALANVESEPGGQAAASPAATEAEAGASPAGKVDAARKEPVEIEVWWPKDAGPFKRQGQQGMEHNRSRRGGPHRHRADRAGPEGAGARPGGGADEPRRGRQGHDRQGPREQRPDGGRPNQQRAERQHRGDQHHQGQHRDGQRTEKGKPRGDERPHRQRREEAARADSPFAVLGALKAELLQRQNGKGGQ
ncbi:helicase-related protein [Rhodoligotrophos defluvii]|uniref:helicase-related protein n=1 Tax=Rhodoligotrophos defluvii TaxID=2561934 RepID=UPI0010C9CC89|nr:helicase-related protein [Rhodoligotrophos defluvii]